MSDEFIKKDIQSIQIRNTMHCGIGSSNLNTKEENKYEVVNGMKVASLVVLGYE